jgi:PIN domain nuclease of toxin-antitoxin system
LNLLLDTHILLWWLTNSRRLSRSAQIAIADSARAYVSAATAWEIAIKVALGKLEFNGDLEAEIRRNNFLPLPLTIAHATAAGRLPAHHRDPFDRMLVAQASIESLTLLTSDVRLKEYGVPLILA